MKSKRILCIVLALSMILILLPAQTLAVEQPAGEQPPPALVDGYYQLATADDLYWFAQQVNDGNKTINGKLVADIVMNENVLTPEGELNGDGSNFRSWIPIGKTNMDYHGKFDGNGKTISGLYINSPTESYIGLFGRIIYCEIENVTVVDSYLRGNNYVGAVVGSLDCSELMFDWDKTSTVLRGCYNSGTIIGNDYVGGIAGLYMGMGACENHENDGNISGNNHVGGIAGDGTINRSRNHGNITGNQSVGGVVGRGYSGTGCNTGSVVGDSYVGGLVGEGQAKNSYNTASVNGNTMVGGVVGYGIAQNSFNIGMVFGTNYVGGIEGTDTSPYYKTSNCYYLKNCARDQSGTVQFGAGAPNPGENTPDAPDFATAMLGKQFMSGEVAYLLGEAFGQTIGAEKFPVHGGAMVYKNKTGGCTNGSYTYSYSNTSADPVISHNWTDATCSSSMTCIDCGLSQGETLEHDIQVSCYWEYIHGHYYCYADVDCQRDGCSFNPVYSGQVTGEVIMEGTCSNAEIIQYIADFGEISTLYSIPQQTKLHIGEYDLFSHPASAGTTYFEDDQYYHWVQFDCCGMGEYQSHSYDRSHSCVCGRIEGDPINHNYLSATCTESKICTVCGKEDAPALGHSYENGFCIRCDDCQSAALNGNVYEIANAGQLYWFAARVNAGETAINGKLMANIVVNQDVLAAIGTPAEAHLRPWQPMSLYEGGTFDGNGKTISGLYCNNANGLRVGLFGQVRQHSVIRNLGLLDSYFSGKTDVGSICGICADGSEITGCFNNATIKCGGGYAGGIAGSLTGGRIADCFNRGLVDCAGVYSGGITGQATQGAISDCYSVGYVTGNLYCGAVVGQNENSTITGCYYLTGCASGGINASDLLGAAEPKTAAEFSSGQVCYLLQGQRQQQIWGQRLGTEPYPVFSSDRVYCVTDGDSTTGYTNAGPGVTLSGKITSYLTDGSITLELIQNGTIIQTSVVSGSNVAYTIENIVPGSYTLRIQKADHATREYEIVVGQENMDLDVKIFPMGDVTGDGAVNVKDFQRLLRHVNKTALLSGYGLACGDVTSDDSCNIKDLQRLLRHVNKTDTLFQ